MIPKTIPNAVFRYLVNCSLEQWELHKLDEAYTCRVSYEGIPIITMKQDDGTDSEGISSSFVDLIVAHLSAPVVDVVEMDYIDTVPEDSLKKEDSGQTTPILEGSTTPILEGSATRRDSPTHHQGPKRPQRSTPYIHPSYYAQRLNARNRTRRAHEEAEILNDLLSTLSESIVFSILFIPVAKDLTIWCFLQMDPST